jgi:hypothetical protein
MEIIIIESTTALLIILIIVQIIGFHKYQEKLDNKNFRIQSKDEKIIKLESQIQKYIKPNKYEIRYKPPTDEIQQVYALYYTMSEDVYHFIDCEDKRVAVFPRENVLSIVMVENNS